MAYSNGTAGRSGIWTLWSFVNQENHGKGVTRTPLTHAVTGRDKSHVMETAPFNSIHKFAAIIAAPGTRSSRSIPKAPSTRFGCCIGSAVAPATTLGKSE